MHEYRPFLRELARGQIVVEEVVDVVADVVIAIGGEDLD
jgi:hypothetical protein